MRVGTPDHGSAVPFDVRTSLLAATPEVQPRAGWDTVTVLVTVKAYPVIARKSGESVCVAGVRLDAPVPQWVRLFPVGFRELPRHQQFKKYDVIRLRAQRRGGSDRRPETYHPSLDTLVVGPNVDTDGGTWQRRGELLGDLIGATSTCALVHSARAHGQAAPSLGLVRPRNVNLTVTENPDYRSGGAAQMDVDLFGTEHEMLEKTPFIATYSYKCADEPTCRGHSQSIVDWESGQLARRNLATMNPAAAMAAHRTKFLDEMCAAGKDVHFYVGNQHQYPGSFLVLGLFWPGRGRQPALSFGQL